MEMLDLDELYEPGPGSAEDDILLMILFDFPIELNKDTCTRILWIQGSHDWVDRWLDLA